MSVMSAVGRLAHRAGPRVHARRLLVPEIIWKQEPDTHDYPAAASYLSLVAVPELVKADRRRSEGRADRAFQGQGHPAVLPVAPAAGRQRACRSRPGEGHQRATTFPGSVGSRCADQRLPVADRRRLPPGLRELSPRREHRHSLPDRGPARGVIQHRRPEVALAPSGLRSGKGRSGSLSACPSSARNGYVRRCTTVVSVSAGSGAGSP